MVEAIVLIRVPPKWLYFSPYNSSRPAEKTHFSHYICSCSFDHYAQFETIGEGRNIDGPVIRVLSFGSVPLLSGLWPLVQLEEFHSIWGCLWCNLCTACGAWCFYGSERKKESSCFGICVLPITIKVPFCQSWALIIVTLMMSMPALFRTSMFVILSRPSMAMTGPV